jgi:hypothetical protein
MTAARLWWSDDLRVSRDDVSPYAPCLRPWPLAAVIAATVAVTGVPKLVLTGRSRIKPHAAARHLAMWVSVQCAGHAVAATGRALGRDHTTVLHGLRRVADRPADGTAADIVAILAVLGGDTPAPHPACSVPAPAPAEPGPAAPARPTPEDVHRLRRRGGSLFSIARRTGLTPSQVAFLLGEHVHDPARLDRPHH